MYKVFISDKPLVLTDKGSDKTGNLEIRYDSISSIEELILKLQRSDQVQSAVVVHEDLDKLWKDFCALFTQIGAAGGVVRNELDQVLFIFRKGRWDLPKGKIDNEETPKEAALREVNEECGLKELQIGRDLGCTYHSYMLNETNILKSTYWFEMTTSSKEKLVPEVEEDITDIRWINEEDLDLPMGNTYAAIVELLQ